MPPRLRLVTGGEPTPSTVERPLQPTRNTSVEFNKDAEIVRALRFYFPDLTDSDQQTMLGKLTNFRIVHRVCDLQKGRYHRWIKLNDSSSPRLMSGGMALGVNFTDNGTAVLCRMGINRFNNFHFDKCLAFERMSDDEVVMMTALSQL
jgi:hypothetical protein